MQQGVVSFLDDGLLQQAIAWANDRPVKRWIYASPGLKELNPCLILYNMNNGISHPWAATLTVELIKGLQTKTQWYNKINLLHPGMANYLSTYCDQVTHSYK